MKARLINFVVKEIEVPILDRVIFDREYVDALPPGIEDPETAKYWIKKIETRVKRYERIDFVVGGKEKSLYLHFGDVIGADQVLESAFNGKLSDLTKQLRDRILELEIKITYFKECEEDVGFYKNLLVVRCYFFLLKLWKGVKRWRLKLAK